MWPRCRGDGCRKPLGNVGIVCIPECIVYLPGRLSVRIAASARSAWVHHHHAGANCSVSSPGGSLARHGPCCCLHAGAAVSPPVPPSASWPLSGSSDRQKTKLVSRGHQGPINIALHYRRSSLSPTFATDALLCRRSFLPTPSSAALYLYSLLLLCRPLSVLYSPPLPPSALSSPPLSLSVCTLFSSSVALCLHSILLLCRSLSVLYSPPLSLSVCTLFSSSAVICRCFSLLSVPG